MVGPEAGCAVYVFDGTVRGEVDAADADAVVADSDRRGYGERMERLGDLDGDGYEDLAVTYSNDSVDLWYGPFIGEMNVEDVLVQGGLALGGVLSGDGDDAPDLAVANEGAVHLFSGPISRGSYDYDDADYVIPTPDIEWTIKSQLIFADADGNGTNELIVGHPDHGDEPGSPGPGLIAVYDLSDW